ncbi:hypothetical protein [Myceligenerans indicum]|nr:hypothetical protein [Myceligenerans indicum]
MILLLVLALLALTTAGARRECARMVQGVERLRPGWPLVLGQLPQGGRATAKSAAMILVVMRDVVEVWGYGDSAPRWTVRRVPGGVSLTRAGVGGPGVYDLQVSDGEHAVKIRPCDLRRLPAFPMSRQSDFETALTALGEEPRDHLVTSG